MLLCVLDSSSSEVFRIWIQILFNLSSVPSISCMEVGSSGRCGSGWSRGLVCRGVAVMQNVMVGCIVECLPCSALCFVAGLVASPPNCPTSFCSCKPPASIQDSAHWRRRANTQPKVCYCPVLSCLVLCCDRLFRFSYTSVNLMTLVLLIVWHLSYW